MVKHTKKSYAVFFLLIRAIVGGTFYCSILVPATSAGLCPFKAILGKTLFGE